MSMLVVKVVRSRGKFGVVSTFRPAYVHASRKPSRDRTTTALVIYRLKTWLRMPLSTFTVPRIARNKGGLRRRQPRRSRPKARGNRGNSSSSYPGRTAAKKVFVTQPKCFSARKML